MWIPKFLAISVVVLLGAACKDDPNSEVCHHYAKLTVDCAEENGDAILEETAYNFCIKGMNPKNDHIFGPKYREKIECTRTAKTCEAYRACEAKP